MEGEAAVDQNVFFPLKGLLGTLTGSIERYRQCVTLHYIDEHLLRTACCVWEAISPAREIALPYAVDNEAYVLAMQPPEVWRLHNLQICQCEAAACKLLWSSQGPRIQPCDLIISWRLRHGVHTLACRRNQLLGNAWASPKLEAKCLQTQSRWEPSSEIVISIRFLDPWDQGSCKGLRFHSSAGLRSNKKDY